MVVRFLNCVWTYRMWRGKVMYRFLMVIAKHYKTQHCINASKNAQKLKGVWGPNQTDTCRKAHVLEADCTIRANVYYAFHSKIIITINGDSVFLFQVIYKWCTIKMDSALRNHMRNIRLFEMRQWNCIQKWTFYGCPMTGTGLL
jgi:hypothetical protein